MAGEFHHNLGGDADGEHETDESLAAAVGADFGVFGDGDIVSAAFAEAGDVDWFIETAELADLADLFEVLVHLLVGDEQTGLRNDGLQQEDIFCGAGINP